MWMKTAIKRLAAWMPQVEILSKALEEDSKADRDTIEASGKSEAEAINEAIAASSVPLPGAQNDADADSSTESDSATQAGASNSAPTLEPAQEQTFVLPQQRGPGHGRRLLRLQAPHRLPRSRGCLTAHISP